jgi:hypothetical protein
LEILQISVAFCLAVFVASASAFGFGLLGGSNYGGYGGYPGKVLKNQKKL